MTLRSIEITPAFKQALDTLEDSATHCFLTGRAGTGKSTLLKYFIGQTKKAVAVLAPTGIAAVNIGGQTIHSFFGFRPNITPDHAEKLARKAAGKGRESAVYRQIDAIVIDEVSMLRADLADCVDVFLRIVREKKGFPFGGVKMIFIGDLYQLPPVVSSAEREIFSTLYASPFFFDSIGVKSLDLQLLELEKIYRQTDKAFIEVLNRIRNNSVTDDDLGLLNNRVVEGVASGSKALEVILTPTNDKASRLNKERLDWLQGKIFRFPADIEGEFNRSSYPNEDILELKKGAQVMMLNNDSDERWINGTMAVITEINKENIEVKLENGPKEWLQAFTWEIIKYKFDSQNKRLSTETVGKFTQYPLKLAWALTIHKSQGKTFDRVVFDLDRGTFAAGQLYVAISRCRSLEGLTLTKPLKKGNVMVDRKVVQFMTSHRYAVSEKEMPLDKKMSLILEAIRKENVLEMIYLKNNDEKSSRKIRPLHAGPMEYAGKTFPGLKAFCEQRKEERTFRVDRILSLKIV